MTTSTMNALYRRFNDTITYYVISIDIFPACNGAFMFAVWCWIAGYYRIVGY